MTFDLELVRYQFPELEHDEWDSNWLVVSGKVVTAERSWNFSVPCLLTMEAHDLSHWLAECSVAKPAKERIFFTEPNLSFEVIVGDSQTVSVRIYFALESLPPGVDVEIDDFFEVFQVSRQTLALAQADLCRSLRQFPVRAGASLWVPPCADSIP